MKIVRYSYGILSFLTSSLIWRNSQHSSRAELAWRWCRNIFVGSLRFLTAIWILQHAYDCKWVRLLMDHLLAKGFWDHLCLFFVNFILKSTLILLDVVDVVFVNVQVRWTGIWHTFSDLSHEFLVILLTSHFFIGLHSLFVIPVCLVSYFTCLKLSLVELSLYLHCLTFLIDLGLKLCFKHFSCLILLNLFL